MMHDQNIVVTIVDDQKKPIREHDFTKNGDRNRKCKVLLPFESEYKILVKNNNDRRVKLEIEIDGTIVSGTGIVVDKNSNLYIERFINVDKKFKFVKPSSDGVADPTNVENGLVKVRVVQEKDAEKPIVIKEDHHHYHYDYWWPYGRRYLINPWTVYGSCGGMVGGCYPDGANISSGDSSSTKTDWAALGLNMNSVTGSTDGIHQWNSATLSSVSTDAQHTARESDLIGTIQNPDGSLKSNFRTGELGEAGATVEGGKSDQVFGTTHWNGEFGEASIFTFQLLGLRDPDQKEYEEYLKLKKKFEG